MGCSRNVIPALSTSSGTSDLHKQLVSFFGESCWESLGVAPNLNQWRQSRSSWHQTGVLHPGVLISLRKWAKHHFSHPKYVVLTISAHFTFLTKTKFPQRFSPVSPETGSQGRTRRGSGALAGHPQKTGDFTPSFWKRDQRISPFNIATFTVLFKTTLTLIVSVAGVSALLKYH